MPPPRLDGGCSGGGGGTLLSPLSPPLSSSSLSAISPATALSPTRALVGSRWRMESRGGCGTPQPPRSRSPAAEPRGFARRYRRRRSGAAAWDWPRARSAPAKVSRSSRWSSLARRIEEERGAAPAEVSRSRRHPSARPSSPRRRPPLSYHSHFSPRGAARATRRVAAPRAMRRWKDEVEGKTGWSSVLATPDPACSGSIPHQRETRPLLGTLFSWARQRQNGTALARDTG